MAEKFKKGMILAAGLGTRLLPITEKLPKPLVPVLNVPNILHSISLMKRLGIKDILLNTHHLAESLETFLGNGKTWGVSLTYSREKKLLGTGGGLKKAEAFFEKAPFVLINCDFVTNFDLNAAAEAHFSDGAIASMILFEDKAREKQYASVGSTARGNLCRLPKYETEKPARTGIFSGIHFLTQPVFEYLKEELCGINDVLYPKLMDISPKRVFTRFVDKGYWYDTGDIPLLIETSFALLKRYGEGDPWLKELSPRYAEIDRGVWVDEGAVIPKGTVLRGPVFVAKGCQIGNRVTLGPNTILGEGCTVDSGAELAQVIGLPHADFPGKKIAPVKGAIQFGASTLAETLTK